MVAEGVGDKSNCSGERLCRWAIHRRFRQAVSACAVALAGGRATPPADNSRSGSLHVIAGAHISALVRSYKKLLRGQYLQDRFAGSCVHTRKTTQLSLRQGEPWHLHVFCANARDRRSNVRARHRACGIETRSWPAAGALAEGARSQPIRRSRRTDSAAVRTHGSPVRVMAGS